MGKALVNEELISDEHSSMGKFGTAFFFLTPFIALAAVGYLEHLGLVKPFDIVVAAVLYIVTGLGVTVMYHRYHTHLSFELPTWAAWLGTAAACLAIEGDPRSWVSTHYKHHQHSEGEEDPHSPHRFGKGFLNTIKGFFWAHMGWMIQGARVEEKYFPNHWKKNGTEMLDTWFNGKKYIGWIILSYSIPTVAGFMHRGLEGAFVGLLLGGFVRVMFVHHVTWCVNSLGHMVGEQRLKTTDQSRDLPFVYPMHSWWNPVKLVSSIMGYILGILSFGELYHNGHHAVAYSAKHAIAHKWHVDVSWWVIRILETAGIASKVKLPKPGHVAKLSAV